jgi:hypothetical protein
MAISMTATFVKTKLMAREDFIKQQRTYGKLAPGTWAKLIK